MCGIAGVVRLDGEAVAAPIVARMSATLSHRGPDGDGLWVDGSVGLAHRRLAIIDLTPTGRQPMSNENGDVLVTYNGEIYNFQSLRVTLEAHGHQFHSQSDTEVIVHAYEEWGEQCVERFNGHFAFALWDKRARKLFAARDRYGVKPLYYYRDGAQFIFASEIKAILAHPGVRRAVSYTALNEYFTFQNVLTEQTLFDGIKLLPPGHVLHIDPQTGTVSRRQYWDYRFPDKTESMSLEEASEELYRLFGQAVTRQLVSDVQVASYLSGGMDSGSITAVARQQLGRLLTFTGGFDLSSASGLELGFDERANSELLSNLLKTEHYEIVLHAGDMEHVMPELIWHLEDLRVGQCYPNYYVARLAGKFVKVVLSGAGGDELFGGYPWRYYRGANSHGSHDYFNNYYNFWQRLVPDEEKRCLFNAHARSEVNGHSTFEVFRSVLAPASLPLETRENFINASLYFELKTFLHGLLVVEDKVSMAHSLETRVPFLDNDLVDFALRVPVQMKLRRLDASMTLDEDDTRMRRQAMQTGDGKIVLRRAMSRVIPEDVTSRTKQGFSAPDASWFRGESIDYINRLLRDPRARIYELLEPAYVARKLDEHSAGRFNHRLLIWSLLSVEWWLRRFFA